jgi:hypothetical protein
MIGPFGYLEVKIARSRIAATGTISLMWWKIIKKHNSKK